MCGLVQGPAAVARAAQAVGQQGFINFYGLQRFGSGGVPTHRHAPLGFRV